MLKTNHIVCDAEITYHNGARVKTAFVTNLSEGIVAQTAPELGRRIAIEEKKNVKAQKKQLPKYIYPDHVLTAALMQRYSHWGIDMTIKAEDCTFIRALDSQRAAGKALFGGGLLLSNKAAAERAAAERAAAERAAAKRWELSLREQEIVKNLGGAERWELSPREMQMIERLGGDQND